MGKKIIENGLFQHHTKETGKEQNHGIFCTCASKRPLSSHRNETICNYGQHGSLLLYTYSFYVYLQWASSVVFFLFSPTRQQYKYSRSTEKQVVILKGENRINPTSSYLPDCIISTFLLQALWFTLPLIEFSSRNFSFHLASVFLDEIDV